MSGNAAFRVLCIVGSPPQLTELVDALEGVEQFRPVAAIFAFDDGFSPPERQLDLLRQKGYGLSTSANAAEPAMSSETWRTRLRRKIAGMPPWAMKSGIEAFRLLAYAQGGAIPLWLRRYRNHLDKCREAIDRLHPDMVMLAVDFSVYGTGAWIRAAREASIPSVLIPFAMADKLALATERLPIPAYSASGIAGRWLARRHPRWSLDFSGRKLLVLPAAQAIAKQLAGVVEANPWTYNDSSADLTLVESEHALEQLVADGASPARMTVTGRVAHDRIASIRTNLPARRAALCAKYGLDPSLPVVVASVTPDKFDVYGGTTEFSSYREMLEFWAQTLSQDNSCSVLASVHPSQPVESVRFLDRQGLRICDEPLAQLLPVGEVFVVDCSATSRLAAACGIPVIDYDLYGFELKFNQAGAGLVHLRSRREFEATWRALWSGSNRLEALREAQQANARRFGVLDGKAGNRMGEAILSLCSKTEMESKQ